MRRSAADRAQVRELLGRGLPVPQIAAIIGIPANTVRRWRRSDSPVAIRWRPAHEESYAYLLGMCLGMDGSWPTATAGPRCLLAFPQHGAGRKHLRPIVLEPWQREIVDRHPGEFVRGLIHSDGCRTTNRFKTKLPSGRVAEYEYGRYFFSNLSGDIRGLFCSACDALGVRWTLSNPRNVSVAHRHGVARLDELGCAKD